MHDPYKYFNSSGGRVWPDDDGVYANATHCRAAGWVNSDSSEMNMIFYIACGVVMMCGVYWTKKRLAWLQKRYQDLLSKQQDARKELTEEETKFVRYMETSSDQFGKYMFLWIGIAIAADVVSSQLITVYTAKELSVPEADGCSDSDSFLTPVEDVFQFFEDGMTVRVGQAIGSGDYDTAGMLLKWASLGGAATGLFGAGASTGVSYIDPIYSFFVPTATSLPSDCAVIPSTDQIQSLARPYWIMTAFSWPALFIQKASIGFFIGTGETHLWSIATVIASGAQVGIFVGLIDILPHTTVYGLSNLVPAYLFVFIAFICFTRPKYVKLFRFQNVHMFDTRGWSVSLQATRDGSELLLKDLALTLQKSGSLIMAARLGLGQQYQVVMYENIQNVFGYSYGSQNYGSVFPIALAYSMRLVGSRMLGSRNYKGFISVLRAYLIGDTLFGLVALVGIVVTRRGLPYYYASDDICQYQEYECSLDTYKDAFGGVEYAMIVTGATCWVNSVFSILQAALYAALDFKFLRNATLACFILIYIPSALVSYLYYESTIGLVLSYNIPIVVLVILYLWRLFYVIVPKIDVWVETKMTSERSPIVELRKSLVATEQSQYSRHSLLQSLNDDVSRTKTPLEHSIDYADKTEESPFKNVKGQILDED